MKEAIVILGLALLIAPLIGALIVLRRLPRDLRRPEDPEQ